MANEVVAGFCIIQAKGAGSLELVHYVIGKDLINCKRDGPAIFPAAILFQRFERLVRPVYFKIITSSIWCQQRGE